MNHARMAITMYSRKKNPGVFDCFYQKSREILPSPPTFVGSPSAGGESGIKQEMTNVAGLHHIITTNKAHFAGLFYRNFTTQFDKV